MIVAHIFEGLGNQLFQYAMGRAVSERAGVPLAIETDWFDTDQGGAGRQSERRRCQLDAFHIEAPRVTRRQLAFHHASATPLGRAVDKLLRLGSGRMAKQVHERGMQFQPEKLDVGPDAYLEGFWQSERYFAPVADIIRREFRLRDAPDVAHATAALAAWRSSARGPLVAVHVRRGDLVPKLVDGQLRRNHGPPTSAPFVRAAMATFPADSRFVVVSDPQDRSWCRQHIVGGDVVYYDGPTDIADFAALRGCDHNIIANSTFSWWAAWLNDAPNKRVVVPKPWFWPDGPSWRVSVDLVPAEWTQLESGAAEEWATAPGA
jgi:hypothetical protein